METLTLQNIKPGHMSIRQKAHPEYGTWGIRFCGMHDGHPLYAAVKERGSINLSVGEFHFWEIVI